MIAFQIRLLYMYCMQETRLNDSTLAPTASHKVLIIDDDANLCSMLKDIVEEYKFESAVAETPAQAIELMQSFKPTLALLDFKLGEVTGLEVSHELKKFDIDLPIILMTAYPSLDLAVKAIQSDIYDFLAKPVDTTYLLRSMNKAIEKRLLTEENKRLIENLKRSNSELERLSVMKSKFLSIVTHDLRLPLTSIRGYSEMLQEPTLSQENKDRCLSSIMNSVDRMGGLINNLMDMVSIEAGKLRVEKSPIDYSLVCNELKQTFTPVSEAQKIGLVWDVVTGPIPVMGDSHRLVQILTNLISNALKHTPPDSVVNIRVTKIVDETAKTPMVLTEVIDHGEGIAPADQAKIFQQFFQVESSPTRRQGLGLGLTITKEIVGAHDGQIGVYSEGLGKGSQFWFTLPIHT